MNTNWTSPKTNIFAGINALRTCLASGYNARLIRLNNEDCAYPIRVKNEHSDFRNYEFSIGHRATVNDILDDKSMSDFEKRLSLNYTTAYGTQEAVDKYYSTGELSDDNFKGMGRSHLVNVDDLIKFLNNSGDAMRADMYRNQYRGNDNDKAYIFNFYRLKRGNDLYSVKKFKRKLWVVEMLDDKEPKAKLAFVTLVTMKLITWLVYPLKFIPNKSVLRMPEYTIYTFRIGDVVHGFSIEFHIPKKFSFK